jgi:hypothetical protein
MKGSAAARLLNIGGMRLFHFQVLRLYHLRAGSRTSRLTSRRSILLLKWNYCGYRFQRERRFLDGNAAGSSTVGCS